MTIEEADMVEVEQGVLLRQVILDEIKGKNEAIHSYDQMIWTVRSGYLTLFFGAWGLLLGAMLKENPGAHHNIILALLLVSGGLALGGLLTDLNYVSRKFKVICNLNTTS
jgi:hypothetical protein